MSPKGNCPKVCVCVCVCQMPFRGFFFKTSSILESTCVPNRSAWGPWIEDKVFALIKMLIFLMPKSIQIAILVCLVSREKLSQTFFFKIFSPEWVDYQPYKMLAKLPCEVSLSLTFTNWLSLIKSGKFDSIKVV